MSESDYNWDTSTSLEFWERFLRCIMTLVEEDQVCYGPIFGDTIPGFDLTVCSAEKNWQMLLDDLVGFLEQEQEKRQWKSISDYMKLQVRPGSSLSSNSKVKPRNRARLNRKKHGLSPLPWNT